eukprot:408008-Prorocentrum_minimum.AAC.1
MAPARPRPPVAPDYWGAGGGDLPGRSPASALSETDATPESIVSRLKRFGRVKSPVLAAVAVVAESGGAVPDAVKLSVGARARGPSVAGAAVRAAGAECEHHRDVRTLLLLHGPVGPGPLHGGCR